MLIQRFSKKSDYKLIESIKKEFGYDIFLNEKIDSKKLSNIVFGDSNASIN